MVQSGRAAQLPGATVQGPRATARLVPGCWRGRTSERPQRGAEGDAERICKEDVGVAMDAQTVGCPKHPFPSRSGAPSQVQGKGKAGLRFSQAQEQEWYCLAPCFARGETEAQGD
jgi:hypothetical protein